MEDVYLTSKKVRARYGNITDMTLWRWLRDPILGFPQPIIIARRRFWKLDDLEQFDLRRAEATAKEAA